MSKFKCSNLEWRGMGATSCPGALEVFNFPFFFPCLFYYSSRFPNFNPFHTTKPLNLHHGSHAWIACHVMSYHVHNITCDIYVQKSVCTCESEVSQRSDAWISTIKFPYLHVRWLLKFGHPKPLISLKLEVL